MATGEHTSAAYLLAGAYRTGSPIPPLHETFPDFDLDDAYLVQEHQVAEWRSEGRVVVGRKVGLTSAAMRSQLGVDQPDFGVLLGDTRYEDGGSAPRAKFISPRVEPEIAFVLKSDLRGVNVAVSDAAAAVGHVFAALEIIDSRIADWEIELVDTVADNASYGGFVLGSGVEFTPEFDLSNVDCTMSRDDDVVQSGRGDAVLGSSINALVWLANTLGERGVGLTAGDVILPGSITAAIPVAVGETVRAEFSGIGAVSITFQ